jgi:hypothetical protein
LANHLIGDDLSLVSWQRNNHRGKVPPRGLDEKGFIGWLDELQVEWGTADGWLSPQLTIELLEWLGDRVVDTVGTQDPSDVTASVSWASGEAVPVWLDQARGLSEWWVGFRRVARQRDDCVDGDDG